MQRLTAKELAKRFDCNEEAIRRRARDKGIGTKLYGRILFSEADAKRLKPRPARKTEGSK